LFGWYVRLLTIDLSAGYQYVLGRAIRRGPAAGRTLSRSARCNWWQLRLAPRARGGTCGGREPL